MIYSTRDSQRDALVDLLLKMLLRNTLLLYKRRPGIELPEPAKSAPFHNGSVPRAILRRYKEGDFVDSLVSKPNARSSDLLRGC